MPMDYPRRRRSTAAERVAPGASAKRLELRTLALGARDQVVEVHVGQSRSQPGKVAQVRPQQALAVDAHGEEVQLGEAAQRRVAAQAAVELQPAHALCCDGAPRLDAIRGQ